ncbi:MAG: SufB/SufD family protein [Candidatus Micrarchaeia archaeon]
MKEQKEISNYRSVPEEGELYKRNFIHIPLEDFELTTNATGSGDVETKAYSSKAMSSYGIRFSAEAWPGGFVTHSKNITTINRSAPFEGVGADIGGRAVAFLESFADRTIEVNAAESDGEQDLGLLLVSSSAREVLRLLVNAGQNSNLKLTVVSLSSSAKSFSGILCSVNAMDQSKVEINYIYNQGKNTVGVFATRAVAGSDASIQINNIYTGASIIKSITAISLDGYRARGKINEAAYLDSSQALDATTSIINIGKETVGSADSRVVANSGSSAIIKSYAKVYKGAEGASSLIREKGITLDKNSKIEAIPMMAIDERNVKEAKHSAGVSPLSDEAVFYLCARGIKPESARNLVVKSMLASSMAATSSTISKVLSPSILFSKLDGAEYEGMPSSNVSGIWF